MKKLIAGFALAFIASPAAQAWTGGGVETMRTMKANQTGPVVRIKGTQIPVHGCCGISCAPRHAMKRHQPVARCPQPAAHRSAKQQVRYHHAAPVQRPAPVYQRTQSVVSEKTYSQRVYRKPAHICPTR
jgi:hypothetical protein